MGRVSKAQLRVPEDGGSCRPEDGGFSGCSAEYVLSPVLRAAAWFPVCVLSPPTSTASTRTSTGTGTVPLARSELGFPARGCLRVSRHPAPAPLEPGAGGLETLTDRRVERGAAWSPDCCLGALSAQWRRAEAGLRCTGSPGASASPWAVALIHLYVNGERPELPPKAATWSHGLLAKALWDPGLWPWRRRRLVGGFAGQKL